MVGKQHIIDFQLQLSPREESPFPSSRERPFCPHLFSSAGIPPNFVPINSLEILFALYSPRGKSGKVIDKRQKIFTKEWNNNAIFQHFSIQRFKEHIELWRKGSFAANSFSNLSFARYNAVCQQRQYFPLSPHGGIPLLEKIPLPRRTFSPRTKAKENTELEMKQTLQTANLKNTKIGQKTPLV